MQRERPVNDNGHRYCDHIMESAKELQEDSQWDPDTGDLGSDEERYTETRVEIRNGQELTIRRKGVREKMPLSAAVIGRVCKEVVAVGGDNLNAMNDADLETEAAKAGVENYPKQASKAKRVAAIRAARATVNRREEVTA